MGFLYVNLQNINGKILLNGFVYKLWVSFYKYFRTLIFLVEKLVFREIDKKAESNINRLFTVWGLHLGRFSESC